jgi:hypothetical protein
MFRKPTVFVLGAGVSVPFGFPSGEKLLQILSGKINRTSPNADLMRQQHQICVSLLKFLSQSSDVDAFVSRLRASHTASIDTWLQEHPDFMEMGKWAIAAVIGNAEFGSKANEYVQDDWFGWLFQAMHKGTESLQDLTKNEVYFITFNYDSMLEWKLEQSINNSYSCSEDEKQITIRYFFSRIIHVHGLLKIQHGDRYSIKMGTVPFIKVANATALNNRRDVIEECALQAQELSKDIRIIGEPGPQGLKDAIAERIANAFGVCSKIILLGFGYDDRNLALLSRLPIHAQHLVKNALPISPADDVDYPVVGTAYNLGKAARRDAQAAFGGCLRLGEKELSCVPFCNDFISLRGES